MTMNRDGEPLVNEPPSADGLLNADECSGELVAPLATRTTIIDRTGGLRPRLTDHRFGSVRDQRPITIFHLSTR